MADLAPLSYSIGRGNWQMNPRFHDLCSFLGLTERDAKGVNWKADEKTRAKLEDLYMWGALRGNTDDHEKIKEQIHKLQRSVGVNWTGKTLVERLWQHTIFDSKFKKAREEYFAKKKALKDKPEPERKSSGPPKGVPAEGKQVAEVKPTKHVEEKPLDVKINPRREVKSEPIDI